MKEDGPFFPREVERSLELFRIRHHAESPLRIRVGEWVAWRAQFSMEALGAKPGPRLEAVSANEVDVTTKNGTLFVLEEQGALVASTAFSAVLPDRVQVGSVFTPPELRGRGHAKAVVAGQLVLAREDGASRAVLFAEVDNPASQGAYRAVGFVPAGRFHLLLFGQPSA